MAIQACLKKQEKSQINNLTLGVSWWLNRIRIGCCHCCGTGLIPGLRTSSSCRSGQTKQNKKPNPTTKGTRKRTKFKVSRKKKVKIRAEISERD